MPKTGRWSIGFVLALCALGSGVVPADPQFSNQQTSLYEARHDWNGLIRYGNAWIKAQPDSPDAWASLGIAYGQGLGRPQDAIRYFVRALALRPNWSECQNALGAEYMHARNYTGAQQAFGNAASQAPQKPNYWNNLAAAYAEVNDRARALQALDNELHDAAPHGDWGVWYALGNGYYHMMAYPQAQQAYKQSLRLNPRVGATWNNFGNAEHSMGNAANALQDYQVAAQLGDSLGAQNYRSLQQAIQQAEAAARNAGRPLTGADRIAALNSMKTAYAHEWHDPASLSGPP